MAGRRGKAADSEIPTLLRVPAAAEGVPAWSCASTPGSRRGRWPIPTGDALKRLADAGILLGDAARLEDEGPPCPAQSLEFFVFGKPARTIHVLTGTGRARRDHGGIAYGSLVGIVALATSNRPTCAEVQTMVCGDPAGDHHPRRHRRRLPGGAACRSLLEHRPAPP